MEEDLSKFVRGFSITAVGIIYSAIIYYAGALVSVNLLGPTQYGLFSLALLIPSIALSFLLFGLDVTAARYIAHNLGEKNEEKALKCAQTIFLVRLIVSLLTLVVFFMLAKSMADLLGEDITFGMQLLSVYTCVYLLSRYFAGVLQGYFMMKERTITEMVANTLNLVLLVPLVYFGFGYISPIIALGLSLFFTSVLSIYYLERAHIPVFRLRFEGFSALKEYLGFSFYVYLSDSFHIVFVWIGAAVIKMYSMPVEAVGYYRAMSSVVNTILLISYGLTIVLYPMLSELNARKQYKRLSFGLRKVITFTLALSIPAATGMFLVSYPLVAVLFPRYIPAVPLLRIFSIKMIFLPLWSIFATSLLILDKPKQQALLSMVLCILGFILSLGLVRFSIEGVALANTIALSSTVVMQYVVLKPRVENMDVGPLVKFCLSSVCMGVVLWVILEMPLNNVMKVGLSVVCGVAVYTFLVLKTGAISRDDIDMVRSGFTAFGRFGKSMEPLLNFAQRIQEL